MLIRKYLFQPIDRYLLPSFQSKPHDLSEVVYRLGIKILILGLSVPLFCANPNFFVIGFFVGVVFDEKIAETAEKIRLLVNKTNHTGRFLIFLGIFFTLPLVASACTFFFPPFVGSYTIQSARSLCR